ncbi:uncharacterized protein LOC142222084 [Haematobia irritans]|uniref:uncharacterized protein LOC142222084 n=1 Tax=Haematobia irritans TaxID=7368 RepID=UPI003F500051
MYIIQIILAIVWVNMCKSFQWCEKDIYETELFTQEKALDVLAIWSPLRAGKLRILSLCSNHTGQKIERYCSYNFGKPKGLWNTLDKGTSFLACNMISNHCKEESAEQIYLMKNKEQINSVNKWPSAQLGEYSISEELCLLISGQPLTRHCVYNAQHYVTVWDKEYEQNSKCLLDVEEEIITNDLNRLYQKVRKNTEYDPIETVHISSRVSSLLAKTNTLRIAADIEITTNILEIITKKDNNPELVTKILEITNHVMEVGKDVIEISQNQNTPSRLIQTMEHYLNNMSNEVLLTSSRCNKIPHGVYHISVNMMTVFYINPECANISGIVVYDGTSKLPTPTMFYDSITKSYYRYLYMNESLQDIAQDPHIAVATYFPESAWKAILNEAKDNHTIKISLYKNNNFFMDQKLSNGHEPDSIILSPSLPRYKGDLIENIPLILRYHRNDVDTPHSCRYWNYRNWIADEGINTTTTKLNDNNVLICKTIHLLPHAVVRKTREDHTQSINNRAVLTLKHESTVDMVSIMGCVLSLFVLLGIWLTVLCCSHWRSDISYNLLINLCFVLSLITLCLLFINMAKIRDAIVDIKNHHFCIAMGAFLQYTTLVLFLWMLFIAVLQYQRHIAVTSIIRSSHFVAKYAVAAWGLPLIPTALLVYLDPNSYEPPMDDESSKNAALCYPRGLGLYFTIVLPIATIMIVNMGIFLYVLCSLRKSLQKFKRNKHRAEMNSQVWLTIFLFLLLSMALVFGILAHIHGSLLYSFLFCITVTVQGFILFIYFVVIDKNVQFSWLRCFYPKDYVEMEDNIMSPLEEY